MDLLARIGLGLEEGETLRGITDLREVVFFLRDDAKMLK